MMPHLRLHSTSKTNKRTRFYWGVTGTSRCSRSTRSKVIMMTSKGTSTHHGLAQASQFKVPADKIFVWAEKKCSTLPEDKRTARMNFPELDQSSQRPTDLASLKNVLDLAIVKEKVQRLTRRKLAYWENSTKVLTLILGQCSQAAEI